MDMTSLVYLCFFSGLLMPATTGHKNDDKLSNYMACDSNGDFLVFWDHDDTDITLEFQVKTTGWFGFGISPAGTMIGADIITYTSGTLQVSHF